MQGEPSPSPSGATPARLDQAATAAQIVAVQKTLWVVPSSMRYACRPRMYALMPDVVHTYLGGIVFSTSKASQHNLYRPSVPLSAGCSALWRYVRPWKSRAPVWEAPVLQRWPKSCGPTSACCACSRPRWMTPTGGSGRIVFFYIFYLLLSSPFLLLCPCTFPTLLFWGLLHAELPA
jgi:hypothetical protein